MNKFEQNIDVDKIQNGGHHKQTTSVAEANDDSITPSQTKPRGRPRKGSLSSNNNSASNSRGNSKERNEAWTCDTCEVVFQSDQSKLLECEYCKTHRCIKCLNMPALCYKGISGREDSPWFCNNCLSKTLKCIREVKSIEERCNEFMRKFEEQVNSRFDKLEHNLGSYRSELDEVKEVIGEIKSFSTAKTPDWQRTDPISPTSVITQATKEVQSRVDRRNNILVFNVPESDSNIKDQVVKNDTDVFLEMCNIVEADVQENDIGYLKRIGKKNQKRIIKGEEKTVPRPLLITLCNENVKHKVMKNVHKLRNADEKYSLMSVKHDMTQEEREQDKKLRAEAKDKQEKDKTGNFLYLVRGMPWERHIQKIKIRKSEQDLASEEAAGPQETKAK